MQSLFISLEEWCRKHKITSPVKRFSEKFLKKKNGVFVWSQKAAKAAQMRHVIFWLRDVCSRCAFDEHGLVRAAMLNCFVEFECMCASHGRFLTPEAVTAVAVSIEGALMAFSWLGSSSQGNGRYHETPKAHMTTHLGYDQAQFANPRRVACYADEDLIGKIKRILEHCHGATVHKRGLSRYLIWVALRWWILLHDLRGVPLQGDQLV